MEYRSVSGANSGMQGAVGFVVAGNPLNVDVDVDLYSLSWNEIGSEGASALSTLLTSLTGLQRLE